MKVSELIEALQKMPQDKEVAYMDDRQYMVEKIHHFKVNPTCNEYPECIYIVFGVWDDDNFDM